MTSPAASRSRWPLASVAGVRGSLPGRRRNARIGAIGPSGCNGMIPSSHYGGFRVNYDSARQRAKLAWAGTSFSTASGVARRVLTRRLPAAYWRSDVGRFAEVLRCTLRGAFARGLTRSDRDHPHRPARDAASGLPADRDPRRHIVIVGAGIAGLAAGLLLKEAGHGSRSSRRATGSAGASTRIAASPDACTASSGRCASRRSHRLGQYLINDRFKLPTSPFPMLRRGHVHLPQRRARAAQRVRCRQLRLRAARSRAGHAAGRHPRGGDASR